MTPLLSYLIALCIASQVYLPPAPSLRDVINECSLNAFNNFCNGYSLSKGIHSGVQTWQSFPTLILPSLSSSPLESSRFRSRCPWCGPSSRSSETEDGDPSRVAECAESPFEPFLSSCCCPLLPVLELWTPEAVGTLSVPK